MTASPAVAILGVPLHNVSMQEALHRMEEFIQSGEFHQVATANTDYIVKALRDGELREILAGCDLIVADGMPLVWAARRMGVAFKERVAGADLVPQLGALSSLKGYRLFLLGASPESSARAAQALEEQFPGVQIAGRLSPPLAPLEEMDNEAILAAIEEAQPDILLVAFGNPKQEKWIYRNRHRLKVPVCMGIGGSLDFLAGNVPRAPRWIQAFGLEWLYRMVQEPRRLAGRYVHDAWNLSRHLPAQLGSVKKTSEDAPASGFVWIEPIGSLRVIRVEGVLAGTSLRQFELAAQMTLQPGPAIVVDLSSTSHIGADALGALMYFRKQARDLGIEVWLTGLSTEMLKPVQAARLSQFFPMARSVADVIRIAAPRRLQLSIETGDGWAMCRLGGELGAEDAKLVEEICRKLMQQHGRVQLDASAVIAADPESLMHLTRASQGNITVPAAPANLSLAK